MADEKQQASSTIAALYVEDRKFAPPAEFPQDAVPFDAPGVELTHHGEDCTFETLQKRFGVKDWRVKLIAEIVHEADLQSQIWPLPCRKINGIGPKAEAKLAAAHIHTSHGALTAQDGGAAGQGAQIGGVPNLQAGHVGQGVGHK